jgi:hypothetical protein
VESPQQRKVEMSRFSRVMSLFAVPVLFAACSPGGTDTPLSPATPRFDGGVLVGGNVTPQDTTPTTTSTTSTSSGGTLDDPSAEPDTTTRRGGVLVGGN